MKNLAIIPARSGSKGLPDKNIIDLRGKPLMYYTIKAALNSGCFEEVMVSTDSERYAEIAKIYGAKIPFFRSSKTSEDNVDSWCVVREVLENYKKIDKEFDNIALLQPTSPLRDEDDIKNVFLMLEKKEVSSVVSVTEVEHPVQWCFSIPKNGSMKAFSLSQYIYMRRQELDRYYRENGAIYVVNANKIMDIKYNIYADNCYAYIMPREKSIDIDEKIDLLMAKVFMEEEGI